MTIPGVPVSAGYPPLEHAALDAISAARSRIGALTRGALPFPPPSLTAEEKESALKDAASAACRFCASLHPGASTAACPRLATFKLNGDGQVVEGSFWPSGASDEEYVLNGKNEVMRVTVRRRSDWDTSSVVAAADLAEEEDEGDDGPS